MQRCGLYAVVFVTGAAVLVIEVLATRVLSPYFGNTIFTISSVLGVVLAALSAGYYAGGVAADRWPREDYFFGIIVGAGLSVLLLSGVARGLLPLWAYELPATTGPLVSSTLLFAPPAFLLGLLSPYAVTLQQARMPDRGVGRVTGAIFFWSTVGGISGSLAAGFLLIPHVGIRGSLIGLALVLTLVGGAGLLNARGGRRWRSKVGLPWIVAVLFSFALSYLVQADPTELYRADGVYQQIRVLDIEWNDRPARLLELDGATASVIDRESGENLLEYAQYSRLLDLYVPQPRRALVLGAGAYSVPRELVQRYPDIEVDVVEIESRLRGVAERYFRLTADSRITDHFVDARRFLHESSRRYDLIFGDAFSSLNNAPPHLTTREFLTLARERLAPGGIYVANLIGSLSRERPSLLRAEQVTFAAVFARHAVFATRSHNEIGVQNFVLLGVADDRDLDFCAAEIVGSADPFRRELCRRQVDPRRDCLAPEGLLTDDHAPVEYYSARLVSRQGRPPEGFNGREAAALARQLAACADAVERLGVAAVELSALGFVVDDSAAEQGIAAASGEVDGREPPTWVATTEDVAGLAVLLESARQLSLTTPVPALRLRVVRTTSDSFAGELIRSPCPGRRCSATELAAAGQALLSSLESS